MKLPRLPFRRAVQPADVDEELRAHIALRADDLERGGLPRNEAERQARVEFGGYGKYRDESCEAAGAPFAEVLLQDIRYGMRVLLKSPGFTLVAVVTLALAIGANAVVFSLLNALVLRPLDMPDAQRLYSVQRDTKKDDWPTQSYPDYRDLRDRNTSFAGMYAYTIGFAGLDTGSGAPVKTWLYETSCDYFDVLGIRPYLGRLFHAGDDRGPDSAPYIVLSYGYWESHFHGDKSIVGRTVRLNQYLYTVVGVAPRSFRGTVLVFAPDMWVPLANQQQIEGWSSLNDRNSHSLYVEGKLKRGVTPAVATANLDAIDAVLAKSYPQADEGVSSRLTRPGLMGDFLGRPVHAFLSGLSLLAALILLAACANLGGLFAARAADRAREVALWLALGASRRRIVRQLLTEAMLISLAGGAAGLAGSVLLLRALSAWQPIAGMPIVLPVHAGLPTYGAALVLAIVSALLFGLAPVRQIMRSDPYRTIKAKGANADAPVRGVTVRDALLVAQIAICAVLVTASLVALRGLSRSMHSSFGFIPRHVLLVNTDLDMARYSGPQVAAKQREMRDAVAGLPGVVNAGYADMIPLLPYESDTHIFPDGTTDFRPSNAVADAVVYTVSPAYFSAAGTGLLAGRSITEDDRAGDPAVAVVNGVFARRLFGTVSKAIGSSFRLRDGHRIRVVGVVEDGRYITLSESPRPAMFRPILQAPSSATWLVIRTRGEPGQLADTVRERLQAVAPGVPLTLSTWPQQLDSALFAARVAAVSLAVLGIIAAMLAITGIFGTAAYSVSRRLRELGIRMALGAQRREVLAAALGRSLRVLAIGSVAGLVLGMAATRVLSSVVYTASPTDPLVLCGAVGAMLLIGVLAAWIPAQRALAVDPLLLLREE